MVCVLFVLGMLLHSCVSADGARASGILIVDGTKYRISSVLAKTDENPFDDTKKDIAVLLTDAVLTLDQFNMSTLYQMSMDGKVHGIMVTFNEDKECAGLVVLGITQKSGNKVCDFLPGRFDLTQISGTVSEKRQESFGHNYEFSIRFESPVLDTAAKPVDEITGTALPPGGGEPGRAYLEYDRAIRTGNLAALKKFAPNEEMAKQLDGPDAKKMIEVMKTMRATGLKITKGFFNGDRATLIVEGTDSATGSPATANVLMVKSGNQWKVDRESWKEQ
jgi:hypothetical protein